MIRLLFGTWRRRLFTLLVCLIAFSVSLAAALSVGLMRSPDSINAVRQVPGFGPLAVSFVEWRIGSLDPTPEQAVEDVPTYRELLPLSAEEITKLLEGLKNQRQLYLDKITELDRGEKRMEIYRKELAEERKQIQLLKDQVAGQWEEVKKAGDTLNRKVTELNALEAKNLKQIATTYESMKPESAALIVKKLDEATAVKTLYLMRQRSAAKIIERLDQEIAARLTERMTLLKRTN